MSAVYDVIPRPDWAGTTTVPTGPVRLSPGAWAAAIYDLRSMPAPVKALFAVREVVARLLRIPPGRPEMLAVDHEVSGEAVIDTVDTHLHFVAAIRPDDEAQLLHMTTAVTLNGLRGRLYFLPVRFLHDVIARALMTAAVRRVGAVPS